MAKEIISLSIDTEVMREIRLLKINTSGEVNEYLTSLLAKYNEDVSGINIRIERINLEKAIKKLNHWQSIKKNIEVKVSKWEEIQEGKEKEKLQKEKIEIENQKKCANCGNLIGEKIKTFDFPIGKICNTCFLSSDRESVKRWNNAKH